MIFKTVIAATLLTTTFAVPALAGSGPSNALSNIDYRLDRMEQRGVIRQGSKADHLEDRVDVLEDRVDRREDRRDRAVNNGPLDRLEDKVDSRENRLDRRENRRDRKR